MHGVSPEVRWACAGGCNGHHEGEHKKTPSCPATSIPNETIRTPVRTKMTCCVHCDVVFFGSCVNVFVCVGMFGYSKGEVGKGEGER